MSQKSYDNSATVYLIPTPIGNMEDITLRSINKLKEVEVIFSEDTRVTGILLNSLNIKKKLISSHKFNEYKNETKILSYLNDGKDVGIVTDRGTPIISDPGYELVKIAIQNNFNVVALPGATALIPALIVSGLSPQPFTFYGFLNNKESKRKKELNELKHLKSTIIFYESPHRLEKTLNNILEVFGNRNVAISREITKKYEEIYRGTIEEIIGQTVDIKGEIVIIVDGEKQEEKDDNLTVVEQIEKYISLGNNSKDAIKMVAKDLKIAKSDIYKQYHRGEK